MSAADFLSEKAHFYKYTEAEKDKKNDVMDLVEKTIGGFGRWQLRICVLMSLLKLLSVWYSMNIIYINPNTQFWCKLPPNLNRPNNPSWPYNDVPQSTYIIVQDNSCSLKIEMSHKFNLTIPCLWGYHYNRSVIQSSIVTDWNLVCGNQYLANLSQSILMGGEILGNILLGLAADSYGRKKIIIFSIIASTIFSGILAVISSFGLFIVFRFLLGLAVGGIEVSSLVLVAEVVGKKWRALAFNTYQSFAGFGIVTMAGLAYIFRDWRDLQLSFTFFNILCISYIFFIDESPRWLMLVGNKGTTKKVLDRIGKINRTKELVALDEIQNTTILKKEELGFKSLLKTPLLRKYTIILSLNWLLVGTICFGVTQYIGQVTEDIYVTVVITGLCIIPGSLISIPLVKFYGRRRVAMSSIVIPFAYLAVLNITSNWVKLLFIGINFIIMGIFASTFLLLTTEIYPTVVRNCGVGCSLTLQRIGSIVAPLVLSQTWVNPLLIFIILSIWPPIFIWFLPETYEINLFETIEEFEQFYAQ